MVKLLKTFIVVFHKLGKSNYDKIIVILFTENGICLLGDSFPEQTKYFEICLIADKIEFKKQLRNISLWVIITIHNN